MFAHLFVPNVLFSFSILACRSIPCCQFPSLSFQLLLPASTKFEIFLFFFFFFFFFFQVGTISKCFEVAFLHPFLAHGHTSSTVCILRNRKQNFQLFIFSLITLFIIFSNLDHLADLKKSISIYINLCCLK